MRSQSEKFGLGHNGTIVLHQSLTAFDPQTAIAARDCVLEELTVGRLGLVSSLSLWQARLAQTIPEMLEIIGTFEASDDW